MISLYEVRLSHSIKNLMAIKSIKNPKIKLNTMSFAPGILRDLFSDDWLDNNSIFIK